MVVRRHTLGLIGAAAAASRQRADDFHSLKVVSKQLAIKDIAWHPNA